MVTRKEMKDRIIGGAKRRAEICESKSHDYAEDLNALANFERIALICDLMKVNVSTPEGVTLFFCIHKLDRLANLISQGIDPKNESFIDNADDLHNYIDLMVALLE